MGIVRFAFRRYKSYSYNCCRIKVRQQQALFLQAQFDIDNPNEWSEEEAEIFNDTLILCAKLAALTPPQGYPHAPYYYSPERLERIYQKGSLDKLLDPRIAAIYRYHFPEELRAKIRAYAKE